jgi:putative solute:sodium symporter small subunit
MTMARTEPAAAAPSPAEERAGRKQRYWQRNRSLTVALLLCWMAVSFVVAFHARALDFRFFGWPFSFWMAAQGAPLVYLLLVVAYAGVVNRLDRQYDVDEDD